MRICSLCVLLAVGAVISLHPAALAQGQQQVSNSLLLTDASGNMGDPIGSGNPEVKIEGAKRAAALSRATSGGSVEVAVINEPAGAGAPRRGRISRSSGS